MKKGRRLQWIGLGLILCGFAALLAGNLLGQIAQKQNRQALSQIQSILPPATPGIMDQYADMHMPSLEVDGRDYIALLQVPAHGVALPVRSQWHSLGAAYCPSRFHGTAYDGSLVIGGSDREGQLAFLSKLQNGDQVSITDMTGAQFAYRVFLIYRTSSATAESLVSENYDLTLFARSSYGTEYIVVHCMAEAA